MIKGKTISMASVAALLREALLLEANPLGKELIQFAVQYDQPKLLLELDAKDSLTNYCQNCPYVTAI